MPPIMGAAAFIIAEYCNISYFEVLKAAVIPAFVSYIALIYIVDLEAKKMKLRPVPKKELPKFLAYILIWYTFFHSFRISCLSVDHFKKISSPISLLCYSGAYCFDHRT